MDGAVNFTAPNPIRNKDLAKAIGAVMHRPSFMPAPAFMIKLLMGEFGSVILNGQRVLPGVLQSKGFNFNFPDMKIALRNLLRRITASGSGLKFVSRFQLRHNLRSLFSLCERQPNREHCSFGIGFH